MLEVGTKAPDFNLPDQDGNMHSLSEYKGKKLILYFYPKDSTSGCTKQACGYSERYPLFTEKGVEVIGISKDSVASHKKFQEKNSLSFTILSDEELTAIKAYDVWHKKKMAGREYMGVVRTTYLIDEDGIIVRANDKVKAEKDPENMLGEIQLICCENRAVDAIQLQLLREQSSRHDFYYSRDQGSDIAIKKESGVMYLTPFVPGDVL